MKKKEILEQIDVLNKQNQEFNKILKDLDKKVKKHLYWWFLLPFFGFIIFQILIQKRKENPQFKKDSLLVKTELVKNEFEILKLKKELEKQEK